MKFSYISDCGCNSEGSTSLQCSSTGKCNCKSNIDGNKCDTCKSSYFGFPSCSGKIFWQYKITYWIST